MRFKNRIDAGNQLADLVSTKISEDSIVLALPRGGVPLGICISERTSASLDLILAKKIGHPSHREFAIGAMTEDGEPLLNDDIVVNKDWLENEKSKTNDQIKNRRKLYGDVLVKHSLKDKVVLLVDDGIATGMTMFAAIKAVKVHNPLKIFVAVPIIPKDTYDILINSVDGVFAIKVPEQFSGAVGAYFEDFSQISDQEVMIMLSNHFM